MVVLSLPVSDAGVITIPEKFLGQISQQGRATILLDEDSLPEGIAVLEEVPESELSKEDLAAISEGRENKSKGKTIPLEEFFGTPDV